jgi:tight adherence protein B
VSALIGCLAAFASILGGLAPNMHRRERVLRRVDPSVDRDIRPFRLGRPTLPRVRLMLMLIGGVVGLAMAGTAGIALGAAIAWIGSTAVSRRRSMRTDAARDEQLADSVRAIAAGLRAGLSVPQSLAYAADEAESPLGSSLRDLVDGLDVGVPLDDALESWSSSMASDDARLLAGVLRLHRRSGGDLPLVLDEVATTLRERRAAAREIRALTAQARLSGSILGLLPIGFFAFLWLTSRRDIEGAFRNRAGVGAIAIGLTLEGIAFLWIKRLLEVR